MEAHIVQPSQVHRDHAGVNGLAVTSLVIGIFSVLFCWGGWLFVATAATAIATGVYGARAARAGKGQLGLATSGLVLGIVAVVLEVLLLISLGRP
jgi:hypothetical protein